MTTNCLHGNTVVYSRTMSIDKCCLCGGYLIWCENPTHIEGRRIRGTNQPAPVRHWHFVATVDETRMAYGPFDRARGANIYGIVRPEPAPTGRGE